MKLEKFLKDKLIFIFVQSIIILLSYSILTVLKVNHDIILLINGMHFCGIFIALIYEFIKKKSYYNQLIRKLDTFKKTFNI